MYKPPRSMRQTESKRDQCNFYGEKGIPPANCDCTHCSDVHACNDTAKLRAYDDQNPHI